MTRSVVSAARHMARAPTVGGSCVTFSEQKKMNEKMIMRLHSPAMSDVIVDQMTKHFETSLKCPSAAVMTPSSS